MTTEQIQEAAREIAKIYTCLNCEKWFEQASARIAAILSRYSESGPGKEPRRRVTCICGVTFSEGDIDALKFHSDCPKQRFINDSCPQCGAKEHYHFCPSRNEIPTQEPRCPKCGLQNLRNEIIPSGVAGWIGKIYCGTCDDFIDIEFLSDFAQFFRPSSPETRTPSCPKCGSKKLRTSAGGRNFLMKVWCEDCPEDTPHMFASSLFDFAQLFTNKGDTPCNGGNLDSAGVAVSHSAAIKSAVNAEPTITSTIDAPASPEESIGLAGEETKQVIELEKKKTRHIAFELIRHCWIHSGYKDCGVGQMTTEQKVLYFWLTGREDEAGALRAAMYQEQGKPLVESAAPPANTKTVSMEKWIAVSAAANDAKHLRYGHIPKLKNAINKQVALLSALRKELDCKHGYSILKAVKNLKTAAAFAPAPSSLSPREETKLTKCAKCDGAGSYYIDGVMRCIECPRCKGSGKVQLSGIEERARKYWESTRGTSGHTLWQFAASFAQQETAQIRSQMVKRLNSWIGRVGHEDYYKAEAKLLEFEGQVKYWESRATTAELKIQAFHAEMVEDKLLADAQRRGMALSPCGHAQKYEIINIPGVIGCMVCDRQTAEAERDRLKSELEAKMQPWHKRAELPVLDAVIINAENKICNLDT